MDFSFPPTTSEERTGARFTVRPANSLSYKLTRGSGVRNPKPFSEKKKQITEEVPERERNLTQEGASGADKGKQINAGHRGPTESCNSVKGQQETEEAFTKLNNNGTADKTSTEFGTDRNENVPSEINGRRDRKKYNLQSRSISLGWKNGPRSPDSSTGADLSTFSGELEKRQTGAENVRRSFNGHSLPSRMKSETSSAPKGQSIQERIEKLFEAAGSGTAEDPSKLRDAPIPGTNTDLTRQRSYKKVEGGTFPRRLSSGGGKSLSPPRMFHWTPQNTTAGGGRITSGVQWQEQMQGRCSEKSGRFSGKGLDDIGTRSLDRSRSRNTRAAQIRSTRAAAGITTDQASSTFLKHEPSDSFTDPFGLRERNSNGSKANRREERVEWETEKSAQERNELKDSNSADSQSNFARKTAETNKFSKLLPSPSSASVRNKISQFEALSQRAPGSPPRRALSVPAEPIRRAIGGLRGRWEGMKEGENPGDKTQKKVGEAGAKPWSERALSVDECGLKLLRKEKEGKDWTGIKQTELSRGNPREGLGKYCKLKSTMEIPLNTDTQRRRGNFYVDEADFSRVTSPEENRRSGTPPQLPFSGGAAAGVQKPTPAQITSPVSDEDKTPTNPPKDSPFLLCAEQPENAAPVSDTRDSASVKSPAPDSSPVPHPVATSSNSDLSGLMSTDLDKPFPKGRKALRDLHAWVAGLNSEISEWNYDENDFTDDDESTEKDDDSDSGESSVTITSNMSQSDRKSFSVSLSELCNFAGVDDDSENDSDEWLYSGRRSVSMSSDVSALSCVTVMPTEELERLIEDVKSVGDDALQDYNDVQVVVLHKDTGVGLGFSLAGGLDQNKPVTVHKVFHSGVAAQEGSIREGDHVLSINGTALSKYSHEGALKVLKKAKSRDTAVVVLRRGDVSGPCKRAVQGTKQGPSETQLIETGQRLCVCLEKKNRDLGFTLEGGSGSTMGDRPLIVQKIFQGGPVDKVCPGDELLDIEGVSTVGMSRLEAWNLIRKLAPGQVNVVLHRPLKHPET